MKLYNRINVIITILCIIIILATPAVAANPVILPENSFYKSHAEECVSCNRDFTVIENGALLYKKPGGGKAGELAAGTTINIPCYYTDKSDVVWGLVLTQGAWVKMSGLELVYDETAFLSQHSGKITDINSEELPDGSRCIWSYPCSGKLLGIDGSSNEEYSIGVGYTDVQGREWASYESMSNSMSGWICLDALTDDSIPAYDYGKVEMVYTKPAGKTGNDGNLSYKPLVWVVIAVMAIALVALQVYPHIKKRSK